MNDPKGQGPHIDLSKAVPIGGIEPIRPVAATLTVIFSNGASQRLAFLEADKRGLMINLGNAIQPAPAPNQ